MTADQYSPDPGDAYLPENECRARTRTPVVIGAPVHAHICREYPDHERPHVCHCCGHQWTNSSAAA